MNILWGNIPQGRFEFDVWNLVRITNEKVKHVKGYEQTFSKEIFRGVKLIQRVPQPVYELWDLHDCPIEGQFYNYELAKATVSPQTSLK